MENGKNGEIVIYQSEDGLVQLDVRLENETVWLSQDQLCLLFNKAKSTISEHISNIFKEGELDESVVVRKFRITTPHGAIEGKTQNHDILCYNLDVIISVGYRVHSIVGTRFRQWATQRLHEYIVKGFTMDDKRLRGMEAECTGKNCWTESGISALLRKHFIARFLTYMQPALIIIPRPKSPSASSRLFKTNSIMRHTVILPQKNL